MESVIRQRGLDIDQKTESALTPQSGNEVTVYKSASLVICAD